MFATNSTIANSIGTNLNYTNITSTNLIGTNSFGTNLNYTNITVSNLYNNIATINYQTSLDIQSETILVSGRTNGSNVVDIDCQNSTSFIGILEFINPGNYVISDESGNAWYQSGYGQALNIACYHQIILNGGTTSTNPNTYVNGNLSEYNTIIQNFNDSIALTIQGTQGQLSNLTQWSNASGTVLSKIDANGNLYANEAYSYFGTTTASALTTYGSEYNFASSGGLTSSTSTIGTLKISLSTGTLLGGTYAIEVAYTAYASSIALISEYDVYLNGSGTKGTLIHQNQQKPTVANVLTRCFDKIPVVLHGGTTANVGLWFKVANSSGTVDISNASLTLYRIQ